MVYNNCDRCNAPKKFCGCTADIDFKCVLYSGCDLTPLTIVEGENLEEVVTKINELFEKMSGDIDNAFVAKSVGNGVEVYQGYNESGIEEFRSVGGASGINVVNENNTVKITIDEDWLKRFYPNSSLRSIGNGVSILDKNSVTNNDNAINTLASKEDSISITKESVGGINIESNIDVKTIGDGKSYIKKKNKKTIEAKSLKSNDGTVIIQENEDNIDFKINPEAVKSLEYYKIIPSVSSVLLTKNGVFKPSSIKAKVLNSGTDGVVETTEGRLAYRFDFQSGSGTTIGFNQDLVLSDSGEPKYVDFLYYAPGSTTVSDIQTITIVREGKDGGDGSSPYVLDLTNDNSSVSATYEGVVVDTSTANTKYTLYYNNTKYNDPAKPVTYTVEPLKPNSITYTNDQANRVIQITDMTTDLNGVFITARIDNQMVASNTFNVTRVKGGKPGEAGTIVYLSISNSIITVDNSNVIIPTVLLAQAYSKKGTDAPLIITSGIKIKYRVVNVSSEGNLTDYTLGQPIDLAPMIGSDSRYIKFYLYNDNDQLLDSEDIPILRNGKDGIYSENRYAKNGSFTLPPQLDKTAKEPAGWSKELPPYSTEERLWLTTATKELATGNLIGEWSDPFRVSGPAGPKGEAGQASDNFIAPMGEWKDNIVYKGGAKRIEAVTYQGKWYVTRADAGDIPVGTPPTNTQYWNASDVNYDFIATGLFLAATAYIDNLGVRNLKTNDSGTRLEIKQSDNSLSFYVGDTFNPAIRLSTYQTANPDYVNPARIEIVGRRPDGTPFTSAVIGTDGISSFASEQGFAVQNFGGEIGPVPTGTASIVGNFNKVAGNGGFGKDKNVGVAGEVINANNNLTNRFFGGYFDKVLITSMHYTNGYITKGSTNINPNTGFIAHSTNNSTFTLPNISQSSSGNFAMKITILKLDNSTVTLNADRNITFGSTTSTSIQLTERGEFNIYSVADIDGTSSTPSWQVFKSGT